jgi:hypothetical protein
MESSRTTFVPEVELLDDRRPPGELSLVDIAHRLERVTNAIEHERTAEREARKVYQEVAGRVEANIASIRGYARSLVDEQRRRMASFDGMIGEKNGAGAKASGAEHGERASQIREPKPPRRDRHGVLSGEKMNIYEAVLRVWSLDEYRMPLTTTEISRAIKDVGYVTRAAPRSMKSTLNQALAKLCRDRLVRRFRTDGTEINPEDRHSRARKYMAWDPFAPVSTSSSASEPAADAPAPSSPPPPHAQLAVRAEHAA